MFVPPPWYHFESTVSEEEKELIKKEILNSPHGRHLEGKDISFSDMWRWRNNKDHMKGSLTAPSNLNYSYFDLITEKYKTDWENHLAKLEEAKKNWKPHPNWHIGNPGAFGGSWLDQLNKKEKRESPTPEQRREKAIEALVSIKHNTV